MPESTSDDPFADLYGKLPDPRSRDIRPVRSSSGQVTPPAPGGVDAAPKSRREAREAARRAATGETPVTSGEAPVTSAGTAGTPAAPSSPAPAEQASVTSHSIPVDTSAGTVPAPRSVDAATAASVSDEPPLLPTQAGSVAPAYSRTGDVAIQAPGAGEHAAGEREATPARRATATLEDLFTGDSSTDELGAVPPPKNKRRRRIGGWIALGIVLVILGGIAGGGWYVWTTYEDRIREVMGWQAPKDYEEGLANGEAFVTIASGDTGSPISQALYDAGVTKTPEAFYDYLIEENLNPPFQPGVYRLQKQMTSAAALDALLDPANKMENTAQVPEGLTVEQTIERLAEGTGIPLEDYQAAIADPAAFGVAAQSLEGWLFPATYTFDPGVTAQDVVQTLVNRTVQSLDAAGVPADDRQRILTIASIIQREARYVADMKKVSTVIQNRLDPSNPETNGFLQMDSTAQYGYGELHAGSASTSEEAQYDDNPWNTYVHTGLPVGPIANPGDDAIDAAVNPEPGPWLYFVTVNLNTGETIFTETYSEHLRYVEQMQRWCSENPGSGC